MLSRSIVGMLLGAIKANSQQHLINILRTEERRKGKSINIV
jgi:hypothetical protein